MDKIADLLEKLAAKLGVTVEYLWPLLVKKTQIDWIASMATSVLILVIGIISSVIAVKLIDRFFANNPHDFPGLGAVLAAAGLACTFIGFISTITDLGRISAYFVPEAATIHNLIEMLR